MAERLSPQDVIFGAVRKPAAPPAVGHDKLIGRIHSALDAYVTSKSLGRLWVGVEIVLDRREGIILQPDITFIVDGRESIVSDRVWGPPDMVLEVTSTLTHAPALEERVAWSSLYGVREYWLVQPAQKEIAILELEHGSVRRRTLFDDITAVRSPLLPEFDRCLGEWLT
jgi:Uma2 family endonuclease